MMLKIFLYTILFVCWSQYLLAQDLVYRVKYQQNVQSNYDNILSASKKDDFKQYASSLNANLYVSFVDSNRLLVQIVPFDTFSIAANLSAFPVWVMLNDNKRIDRLYFNSAPQRQEEVIIRTLLSFIQYFQINNIPNGCCSEEEFIDGKYLVAYSRNAYGVAKTVQEITTGTGTDNMQRIIIDHYHATYFAKTATSLVDSINIIEKKHQKIQNKIIAFIKSTFELKRVTDQQVIDRSNLFFDPQKMYTTRLYSKPDAFQRNKLISERVLQNQPLDTLVNQLNEIKKLSFEQRVQLASRFRAFLFLHPGRSNDFSRLLATYTFYSDEYSLLLDAIVNTPLPEAQNIITRLINQYRNNQNALRQLLPKAAGSVLPDRELLNALLVLKLRSSEADIASLSGLCLSNLLRSARNSIPQLCDSITGELQHFYRQQEKNDDNIIQFLLEAGNIGDTLFVDSIALLVRSGNKDLQKEALYALRFMHNNKTDNILAVQLSRNPDSSLFASIYETMKIRRLSVIMQKAILKYISQNGVNNEKGCLQLLTYLLNFIDESRTLATELESIKSTPKINNAVNEILQKYKGYQSFLN